MRPSCASSCETTNRSESQAFVWQGRKMPAKIFIDGESELCQHTTVGSAPMVRLIVGFYHSCLSQPTAFD